jgi:hypothetical protein
MRTTHFSPGLLERFERQGRGRGTGPEYDPWHQVRRAEPASRGRSHLISGQLDRLHHFLSDNELVVFALTLMLGPEDLREQFPLALESHPVERMAYEPQSVPTWTPGTLEIARELGIKHPVTRGQGKVADWVLTTDLVVTLRMPNGKRSLVAIAVKQEAELKHKRTLEKLRIEREYWVRQEVNWLLITPEMINREAAETIKASMPWVLSAAAQPESLQSLLGGLVDELNGLSFTNAFKLLALRLQVTGPEAQNLFWHGVWAGVIRLDLSVPLRPASRVKILSAQAFREQNPLAMRRTAWQA